MKIESDCTSCIATGGFSSWCIYSRQYAMPMMTLILTAQSRSSNSLTAKIVHSSCRRMQAYELRGYAKAKSLTVKMLWEIALCSKLKHHHSHERLIFVAIAEEIDKVLVVNSWQCIYLHRGEDNQGRISIGRSSFILRLFLLRTRCC